MAVLDLIRRVCNALTDTPTIYPVMDETAYRRAAVRPAWALVEFGARMASPDVLDQLARQATLQERDWDGLRSAIESGGLDPDWKPRHVLGAAVLNSYLAPSPETRDLLHRATGLAIKLPGFAEAEFEEPFWMTVCQAAALVGDADLLRRLQLHQPVDDELAWSLRAELALPRTLEAWTDPAKVEAWWTRFNRLFELSEIEGWRLDQGPVGPKAGEVFSRIRVEPPKSPCTIERSEQPLVSVIVPTYNPGPTYRHTIESLIEQSWQNLEIVIVDDCSTSGTELIAEAAARDPRVRVLRPDTNGGAYRARNLGIQSALGDYVTVLDADDLAHPRRVELQVAPLLAHPELTATLSRSARMTGDGSLISYGFLPTRKNLSSLLFRRTVVDEIGYYDDVRKAADTEYLERLHVRYTSDAVLKLPLILGLVQLTTGSLSRGDFTPGWWDPSRLAYRRQFRSWHQRLGYTFGAGAPIPGLAAAFPEPGRPRVRPFDAPPRIRGEAVEPRIDAAVLADWSGRVQRREHARELLGHLASRYSGPIGLVNGARLTRSDPRRRRDDPSISEAVSRGEARWVGWSQATRIGTLYVSDPEYLTLLPAHESISLTVDRVVIYAHAPVSDRAGRGRVLQPAWIERLCRERLGVSPEWRPTQPDVAASIARARETRTPGHGASAERSEDAAPEPVLSAS